MARKAAQPKPKDDEMTENAANVEISVEDAANVEISVEDAANAAVDALPNVTFSGSVSAVVNEAVEGYRWQNRLSRADVVKEALTQWCETRALMVESRARLMKELIPDELPLDQ